MADVDSGPIHGIIRRSRVLSPHQGQVVKVVAGTARLRAYYDSGNPFASPTSVHLADALEEYASYFTKEERAEILESAARILEIEGVL